MIVLNYRISLLCITFCIGLTLSHAVQAIDPELYQKYQIYKSRQQTTQTDALEQARSALRDGHLETAQHHLETARNLADSPDAVRTLEQQISAEKTRREQERLAQEKHQREAQERLAQENRQREAQERLAQQKQTSTTTSSSSSSAKTTVSASDLDSNLSWGYDAVDIHIPPVYETKLKERGVFFTEYYLETTESQPARTETHYKQVYFAIRLHNPANRTIKVTYKVKAREQFSLDRGVQNTIATGAWALVGAGVAAYLAGDNTNQNITAAGAALGAGYGLSRQQQQNSSFNKEKTFTVSLKAGEESYETGKFPIYQPLSQNPTLEIVSVQ